jgi:glucose-1-phosphate thymidylyltransferase
MSIVKGVILAGGTGSRLDPLTRITNKHLLPIYDRPMITYAVDALVDAGIGEIMIVSGGPHAGEFLRLLGNGDEWGIDRLTFAYQDRPGGIAHALGLAERFVGSDDVCVMLGDNIFEDPLEDIATEFVTQGGGARVVLARRDDPDHLRQLGVPEFDAEGRIVRVVEKPADPPSNFAVTGVYFYPSDVFDVVKDLRPSGRGELEITDVNNWFIAHGEMQHSFVEGFWGDAGESVEHYYAVNDVVRSWRGARAAVGGVSLEAVQLG